MRESSTDLFVDLPESFSTSQLLVDRLARGGGPAIYAVKRAGEWVDVSTAAYVDGVRGLAKSLIGAGIRPGDSVAIMSRTRYEWALAEQAVWFAGAVSVPIYETSSPYQIEWILRDSGARHVLAEGDAHAEAVAAASASLGDAVTVWTFDRGTASGPTSGADSGSPAGAALEERIAAGHADPVTDAEVEAARTSRRLSDPASLVYTSGTTGRPKGCVMTHANFSLVAVNLVPHMNDVVARNSRTLMFLPLAHVLARAVQQVCVHADTTVAHTSGAADLMADLASFKPTFLLAVPRIFEKIRSGAMSTAESAGKGGLFASAERTAILTSKARDARARGTTARRTPADVARHLFFDRVLYPKLRNILGGKAKYTISGASELNTELAHFFRGAGVELLEGYGLTETTAPATVNRTNNTRVGSVGIPIPGTTVRIADDGEVLLRGIGVFAGYHNNPDASVDAFDSEGFFRTGDLGSLDRDGFLTITGRKKDLLVTAGGKNIAPGPLEELVRTSRIVSQVVVVGENRPFVAALVTLDPEGLGPWATANGLGGLTLARACTHPLVVREVQAAVDLANATVSKAEGIRKFVLLEREFTEASGHLTPSLKLKRGSVIDSCAADIEALYAPVPAAR